MGWLTLLLYKVGQLAELNQKLSKIIVVVVVVENPGKIKKKIQNFRKIQKESKKFPWPLGGPWEAHGKIFEYVWIFF